MLRRTSENNDRAALQPLIDEVVDPVLLYPLGDLGLVTDITFPKGAVEVVLHVPTIDYPGEAELNRLITAAIGASDGREVRVKQIPMGEEERTALGLRIQELSGAASEPPADGHGHGSTTRTNQFAKKRGGTRVLAISSGKGGVGKSSVTVNLAVALARQGFSVGLLDADIYGFSVPRMMGVPYPPIVLGKTIMPPVAHGVRCISMGFFVDEENAVAWRGPMLHKALEQFLVDVHWGSPDFLVIDMPPGTGDIAMSVAEQLPTSELYVVTTPQPSAERVAQRSGALGKQLRLSVRGVIENMSWFVSPDGTRHEIFGAGGGDILAKAFDVPLLAQLPLVPAMREAADNGDPVAIADPDGEVTKIFDDLAAQIAALGPARVYRSELSIS